MKKNKDTDAMGELNISLETFPYREHYYSFVLTKMLYVGGANHEVSTKHSSLTTERANKLQSKRSYKMMRITYLRWL